ncbi:MAG: sporulation protein YqfD [Cellulosilyticaceae bacterium]
MFVTLWNYLKGYVIVEVKGYSLEKFLNLCLKDGIEISNVQRTEDALYIKTSIPSFKALKPHAKKAKCRLRIVKKTGLPFIGFRYRKRHMLIGGAFVFAFIIYILSSFVWLVEVQGAKRLSDQDIITTLAKAGYTTGKLKRKLDLREAEKYLVNTYPEVVWSGIKFDGTRMLIQVAESVPKPEIYDESVPSDIIAKRDGLITYIATDKGMPQVKKGDTVKKGDFLVLGTAQLQDEQSTPYYMHAKADIKAKTVYKLINSMSLDKVLKQYTGNVANAYSVRLFNKKIPLYNKKVAYVHSDQMITVKQLRLTQRFPLPFYFEKQQKIEYNPIITHYDTAEAKDELLIKLWDELTSHLSSDAKVLNKQIVYNDRNGKLEATLEVIVEENIGETIPIQTTPPAKEEPIEGVN